MSESDADEQKPIKLQAFLESVPVLARRTVTVSMTRRVNSQYVNFRLPAVQLHCPRTTCGGIRFFDPDGTEITPKVSETESSVADEFFDYWCRNCRHTLKTYAVRLFFPKFGNTADILKLGEFPAFGEPRPNIVRDVLDDEIEFFERGYRAETANLGIGAFAYYRRFVESHKDKIVAEIRKVAVAQGAKQDVIDRLDKAAKVNSFENAVKIVKDAIPDSLRHTGGHNPLTLLHDALSAGLHNEDDEQCLELAKDIRLLLSDLAERTTQALKNNSELSNAVNRLLKKATARSSN